MFLLWSAKDERRLIGPVGPWACPNCGAHAAFDLIQRNSEFRVFFIPVKTQIWYEVACPNCGTRRSIERDEALTIAPIPLTGKVQGDLIPEPRLTTSPENRVRDGVLAALLLLVVAIAMVWVFNLLRAV